MDISTKPAPVSTPVSTPLTPADNAARARILQAQQTLAQQQEDARFKHEREQLLAESNLDNIDDDVEDVATLLEWQAPEYRPKADPTNWYIIIAISVVVIAVSVLFFLNFLAAITIGLAVALLYYISHREPEVVRFRIMVDGVALNNYLYHYTDLDAFNVVYEADGNKLVLIRSKKYLAPLLMMDINNADPVDIRTLLLEFLPEDQTIEEPVPDFWARRLGV